MAQEYDKYEYWRQFDDNSRWVGFKENVPIIQANEDNVYDDDDTLTMLDYVLARTSAFSPMNDEEQFEKRTDADHSLQEDMRQHCRLQDIPETDLNEKHKIIPIQEIEKKLGDTFDKLKQNC